MNAGLNITSLLGAPLLGESLLGFGGITVPQDAGTWALIVACFATTYVFLKARRQAGKRDATSASSSRSPFSSPTTQRRIENQMTELLVELEKMVRELNAQLDTRSAKLEELIRQADERLAELDRRAGGGVSGGGGFGGTLGGGTLAGGGLGIGPAGVGLPVVERRVDVSDEEAGEARRLRLSEFDRVSDPARYRRAGSVGEDLDERPAPAPIPIDPRHALVYQLADMGQSAMEIARETGQPTGEVELILALRRRAAR